MDYFHETIKVPEQFLAWVYLQSENCITDVRSTGIEVWKFHISSKVPAYLKLTDMNSKHILMTSC